MDIQIGTRIWDNLNSAGLTVTAIYETPNGSTRYTCKDDSPHVGDWTLAPEDFDGERFEMEA